MQHNGTKTNLFTDEQTIYFEIYLTEYEQFLYKVKNNDIKLTTRQIIIDAIVNEAYINKRIFSGLQGRI